MDATRILELARAAKAKGWTFTCQTYREGRRKVGCLAGAVAWMERQKVESALDAAEVMGVPYDFAAGMVQGFDAAHRRSDAPDYQAGYDLGRQARDEFLTA